MDAQTCLARPSSDSVEVRLAAAVAMCRRLKIPEGAELDVASKDMAAVVCMHSTFEAAKRLSNASWEVDDDTLEVLADRSVHMLDAQRIAVAEWVLQHGVRPQCTVGVPVDVVHLGRTVRGEIVSIDAEQAQYTVFCACLGQVRQGVGTNGLIVDFERVHDLAGPAEAFTLEG